MSSGDVRQADTEQMRDAHRGGRLRRHRCGDPIAASRRTRLRRARASRHASVGPGGTTPIPGADATCRPTSTRISFALNPDWTRTYADQGEIWAYLEATAERRGVLPHVRFSHNVLEARWDGQWSLDRRNRPGFLLEPVPRSPRRGHWPNLAFPTIPGAPDVRRAVVHSARWDPTQPLDGRRVAVLGTGASAVQIVPSIQPRVDHLDVFQRTPGWVLPHPVRDVPRWQRRLFRLFPRSSASSAPSSTSNANWSSSPPSPSTTASARPSNGGCAATCDARSRTPSCGPSSSPTTSSGASGCLPSNEYFPALCQPNVELVTDPIVRIEPEGLLTADGRLHRADVIVYATGFHVSDNPMAANIVGRDGHRLSEAFVGDLPHHLGTTFPHFPNFFMLTGPNTGTGHTSQVFMIECQLAYVIDALMGLPGDDLVIEVLPSVAEESVAELARRFRRTVWASGCSSWYLNEHGRNVAIWPDYTLAFRRRTRRFDDGSYVIGRPLRRGRPRGSAGFSLRADQRVDERHLGVGLLGPPLEGHHRRRCSDLGRVRVDRSSGATGCDRGLVGHRAHAGQPLAGRTGHGGGMGDRLAHRVLPGPVLEHPGVRAGETGSSRC